MGYRNSVLTPKEKILIPADRWERFTRHVAKSAPFLPGHCDRNDGDIVSFGYGDAENLWFPRDMRTAFPDGPEYVIHKMGRDGRFAPTIAAIFMLFRQDCLDSDPVECVLSGNFFDAQYGLDCLRDAGVWEGGPKCLLCREDVETGMRKSETACRNAFMDVWDAPGIPDVDACLAAAEAAMGPPEGTGISERDAEAWKGWVRIVSGFGYGPSPSWRLGAVSDGAMTVIFPDEASARKHFRRIVEDAGDGCPRHGSGGRISAEIHGITVSVESVGFDRIGKFTAMSELPVAWMKSDGTLASEEPTPGMA